MRVSLSDGLLQTWEHRCSLTWRSRNDDTEPWWFDRLSEKYVHPINGDHREYTRFESPRKGYASDVTIDLFMSKVSSQVLTYALAFCSWLLWQTWPHLIIRRDLYRTLPLALLLVNSFGGMCHRLSVNNLKSFDEYLTQLDKAPTDYLRRADHSFCSSQLDFASISIYFEIIHRARHWQS